MKIHEEIFWNTVPKPDLGLLKNIYLLHRGRCAHSSAMVRPLVSSFLLIFWGGSGCKFLYKNDLLSSDCIVRREWLPAMDFQEWRQDGAVARGGETSFSSVLTHSKCEGLCNQQSPITSATFCAERIYSRADNTDQPAAFTNNREWPLCNTAPHRTCPPLSETRDNYFIQPRKGK